jgi:hypothetical protein
MLKLPIQDENAIMVTPILQIRKSLLTAPLSWNARHLIGVLVRLCLASHRTSIVENSRASPRAKHALPVATAVALPYHRSALIMMPYTSVSCLKER